MSTWLNLLNHQGLAGAGIAFLAFMGAFAIAEVFIYAPVADRLMVTRTGWRLHVGRCWYRKGSIVLYGEELLDVIDFWQGDWGDPPITWVLAIDAGPLAGDDDEACWFPLERLARGPSRREWRRILRESAAA